MTASNAIEMRAWRITHGYTTNMLVPITTLAKLLDLGGEAEAALTDVLPSGVLDAIRTAAREGVQPRAKPKRPRFEFDQRVITRFLNGEDVVLSTAERRELVQYLTFRGQSAAKIGESLGLTDAQVYRIRSELKRQA